MNVTYKLQFDKKYVFNVHLSVVHGEKLDKKQDPDSQPSVIPEVEELEIINKEEENSRKIRKVSMKTTSGHEGKKQFQCEISNANFRPNCHLNRHFRTVHEGKKKIKCDICNTSFGQKSTLSTHVAIVHEDKKQFKCDICNTNFGQKSTMNTHVATVHEGKKQLKCELCISN